MSKPLIQIVDLVSNSEEIREMNADELTNYKTQQAQVEAAEQAKLDFEALKASAKAKLIAGERLTAAEADILVI